MTHRLLALLLSGAVAWHPPVWTHGQSHAPLSVQAFQEQAFQLPVLTARVAQFYGTHARIKEIKGIPHAHGPDCGHGGCAHGYEGYGRALSKDGWRLIIALALTLGFTALEFSTANGTHSSSLLADFGHMATDSLSLLVALIVHLKARAGSRLRATAALSNGVLLIGMMLWIAVEAVQHLVHPSPIEMPQKLTVVAAVGVLINLLIARCLYS